MTLSPSPSSISRCGGVDGGNLQKVLRKSSKSIEAKSVDSTLMCVCEREEITPVDISGVREAMNRRRRTYETPLQTERNKRPRGGGGGG